MIEALRRRGGFTAMTGDGVSGSPSLRSAEAGIGEIGVVLLLRMLPILCSVTIILHQFLMLYKKEDE